MIQFSRRFQRQGLGYVQDCYGCLSPRASTGQGSKMVTVRANRLFATRVRPVKPSPAQAPAQTPQTPRTPRLTPAVRAQYVPPLSSASANKSKPRKTGGFFSSGWSTTSALGLAGVTGLAVYLISVATFDPRVVDVNADKSTVINVQDIPVYGSTEDTKKAIEEARKLIGDDAVSTDNEELVLHGYSSWSSINVDRLPSAVVYPKTTEEVSNLVKIFHKYRIPMIPFSGGSSLEGNFSAPFGGISIDFTFMDKIVQMHEEDMDVVVQPAVSWMDLNEKIKSTGLFFPIDPGPSAKIGGMVGTNCRYGTMKDWVINMTVVLADGTVVKTRKRPRKTSAGYNLNSLFIGSEGTLGLVTEVTLKLAVIPAETSVGVVTFSTIREAAAAASKIIRSGVQVAALELMDDVQMMVINKTKSTDKIKDNIDTVTTISREHNSGEFEFAKTLEEQKKLWSARKEALWSMLALRDEKSGGEVWSTDVAVPLSRLADIIESSKEDLNKLGMFASILGHVGDGNFHESIMYDKNNAEERAAVEKCVHDMVDKALDMDGTCTGEHGVGLGKKGYLVKELGIDTLALMRKIKLAMDPLWLLNPGKIVDVIQI